MHLCRYIVIGAAAFVGQRGSFEKRLLFNELAYCDANDRNKLPTTSEDNKFLKV